MCDKISSKFMLEKLKIKKADIIKAFCDAAVKDIQVEMDNAFLKSLGSPLMRPGDCWYLWNRNEIEYHCVLNYKCKTEKYACLFCRIREINLFGKSLRGIILFEETNIG